MIKGIIILLGTLYIIEIEAIYNIIYFIGIVISIAIIIYKEGIIYISLILIIVYSTALIILFGFIMMKGKKQYPWSTKILTWYNIPTYTLPIISIITFIIVYNIIIQPTSIIETNEEILIYNREKIRSIGEELYTNHYIELFLSAILLLFPIFSLLFLSI